MAWHGDSTWHQGHCIFQPEREPGGVLALLLGIGLATLAGNLMGARLLTRVPEEKFTLILNWLLTALALRLVYQGISALLTAGN